MKKLKTVLLLLIIVPCVMFISACQQQPYVVDLFKSNTIDNVDIYTIKYSDGSISTFSVGNKTEDNEITIEQIWEAYKTQVEDISFEDFLHIYLDANYSQDAGKLAVQKAMKSSVTVYADAGQGFYSCGAGVIYAMDDNFAYIVTNYHVIAGGGLRVLNGFFVNLYGVKTDIDATYVGGSYNYDLAVLKCNKATVLKYNPDACTATIANGYSVGETAIAIGNPNVGGFSVSRGVVNVDSEEFNIYEDVVLPLNLRVMRIDAPVYQGNSGGGLFNSKGELIGIVNGKCSAVGDSANDDATLTPVDNIGYAIPVDNVCKIVDNILFYNKTVRQIAGVRKFNMGITIASTNSHAVYDGEFLHIEEDVVVSNVQNKIAGLDLQIGDTIKSIKINGGQTTKITRLFQLQEAMLDVHDNEEIELTIIRNEQQKQVSFTTNNNNFQIIQ